MSEDIGEVCTTEEWSFRKLLGTYPTGVVLVSSNWRGEDCAMVVNSFVSVSLTPPLVAFCAAETSTTWPKIRSSGACAISVLDEDQTDLCQQFVTKDPERFNATSWSRSSQGYIVPYGSLSTIECDIFDVVQAGDHDLVVLLARSGWWGASSQPLIFDRGLFKQVRDR